MAKDVALIVGVGPGLGAALARRFARRAFWASLMRLRVSELTLRR